MPGTAKMIFTSCSLSHGPNQPRAPNNNTKIKPEITGETLNGKSTTVISRLLPRKIVLGNQPRGGDAEDHVERHRDGRGQQGEPDRLYGIVFA